MRKAVAESTIALVTTAGVHLKSQEPFNMEDPDGDPSFRAIPSDVRKEDLTITHKYYDHSAADRDINVVLPLDRIARTARGKADRRDRAVRVRLHGAHRWTAPQDADGERRPRRLPGA